MKKINIILLLLGFLLITSCKESSLSVDVTRVIHNATSQDVQLNFFSEQGQYKINIGSAQSDSAQEICEFQRGSLMTCDLVFSLEVDSVQLNFDDQKRLTYCLTERPCSLINEKNIMILDIKDPSLNKGFVETEDNVYVFTITESDYELTEPIK